MPESWYLPFISVVKPGSQFRFNLSLDVYVLVIDGLSP